MHSTESTKDMYNVTKDMLQKILQINAVLWNFIDQRILKMMYHGLKY